MFINMVNILMPFQAVLRGASLMVLAALIQLAPFAAYSHSSVVCFEPCCSMEKTCCSDDGASDSDCSSCYTCVSRFFPYATLTNPSPDNSIRRHFPAPHYPLADSAAQIVDLYPTNSIDKEYPPGPPFLLAHLACTVLRL